MLDSVVCALIYLSAKHVSFPLSCRNNTSNSFVVAACPDLDNCVTPSVYAMVGATAALAGVSRMTGKNPIPYTVVGHQPEFWTKDINLMLIQR